MKNGKCPAGEYYCYTNKECKPIPAGFMVDPQGMLRKENGASTTKEEWSQKYKKSINCDNPKGFSQRAHCQGRKKKMNEATFTHKTPHLKKSQHQLDPNLQLKHLVHHSTVQYVDRDADGDVDVYDKPGKKIPDELPPTSTALTKRMMAKQKGEIQHSKKAVAYEGNLHKWFQSKSKDGKPGWVNVVTGGTCASDEPGEGVPKCVSSEKRASMTPAERRSASRRKKAADPGQQQKSGAAKPTYVSTDSPKKKMSEAKERDHEYSMARSELSTIMNAARRLKKKMKGEGNIEAWVQSKITKAADYIDTAADYVDSGEMNEESDKKGKSSGNKDACYHKVKSRYDVWPSAYASGALVKCRKVGAKNWGNKSESLSPISQKILAELNLGDVFRGVGLPGPFLNPQEKQRINQSLRNRIKPASNQIKTPQRNSTTDAAIDRKYGVNNVPRDEFAGARKNTRQTDAAIDRKYGVNNVPRDEFAGARKNTRTFTQPASSAPVSKPVAKPVVSTSQPVVNPFPTRDSIKPKTPNPLMSDNPPKSKMTYKTPNPLMQRTFGYQTGNAPDQRLQNSYTPEGEMVDEKCWVGYTQKGLKKKGNKMVPNCVPVQEDMTRINQNGQTYSVILMWRGKTYTFQMFVPTMKRPSKIEIEKQVQKAYPDARVMYFMPKQYDPTDPTIMIPEENEIVEDWQSVNRKDKTDGLSQKAVNAYRRENPGSKLQTAVTEKNPSGKRAKRRASFCRRMKGMKSKLTSAKTARDPDSRINKALRRWNCN
jgi:hypothetical protein